MKSEFVSEKELAGIQYCMKDWRDVLALEVSRATGLRIGDVLAIKTADLKQRMSIKEAKTGKTRRIYLGKKLLQDLKGIAGKMYVFEGVTPLRHRSYDSVYKSVRRAYQDYEGEKTGAKVSPHSWRKAYAVRKYQETGDIHAVQRLMGHDNEITTLLYALADKMSLEAIQRRKKGKV